MSLEFETTVFTAPQGEALAKVYVVAVPTRDVTDDELAAYRLSGNIIGPRCKYSSTLQTKIPFRHRGFTPCGYRTALLAEAVVPDPCYWSSELPFLYRAVGEVTGDVAGPQSFDQTFGIRSIGTSRNRFTLNDKVWVPRIVSRREVTTDTPLAAWRETDTTMLVSNYEEGLLQDADATGVLLAVHVADGGRQGLSDLMRLSRHPSVAIVLIESHHPIPALWRTVAQNVLFVRSYHRPTEGEATDETDAYYLPCYEDGRPFEGTAPAWPSDSRRPCLPWLPLPDKMSLPDARARCDQLQRALAGVTDVAGYFV